MDAQACLARIIDAARDNDRDEYIAACEDLAEWLGSGGFAPVVPVGTRYIPGTGTPWALLSPVCGVPTWVLVRYGLNGRQLTRSPLKGA